MIARLMTLFAMMTTPSRIAVSPTVFIVSSTGHTISDGANLIIQKD
jgi:hypothetical protein